MVTCLWNKSPYTCSWKLSLCSKEGDLPRFRHAPAQWHAEPVRATGHRVAAQGVDLLQLGLETQVSPRGLGAVALGTPLKNATLGGDTIGCWDLELGTCLQELHNLGACCPLLSHHTCPRCQFLPQPSATLEQALELMPELAQHGWLVGGAEGDVQDVQVNGRKHLGKRTRTKTFLELLWENKKTDGTELV